MVAFSERQLRVCRCSCQRRPWGFVCPCVPGLAPIRAHAASSRGPSCSKHSHPNPPPAKMAKGKGTKAKRTGAKAGKGGSISKGGVRRLARRAGVKRIRGEVVFVECGPVCVSPHSQIPLTPSAPVYDEVRGMLKTFLKSIMADTVCVCELTKRRTVSAGPAKHSVRGCVRGACVTHDVRCLQSASDRLLVLPRPPTCCTP